MAIMLLTGTHPRSMDEKKRVAIPKPIRDLLGRPIPRHLYIAPDPAGCLCIYKAEDLERFGQQQTGAVQGNMELEARRRIFFSQAEASAMDKQGRVVVPERLVQYAGLGREVVMVGVHDHLELWSPERWDQYRRDYGA